MLRRLLRTLLALCIVQMLAQAQFPSAQITNGTITADVYLPNADHGYYRGVRFDWAGVISHLFYQGHDFFGQWFPKYDPTLHDSITGPVEEFRSEDGALGFARAHEGGLFVKIGVGLLRKIGSTYNFARSYQLAAPGTRVVRVEDGRVEFEHELSDGEGYAYRYKKTVLLPGHKAELVLEHSFKNVGKRPIDTDVYDHDFFVLDHSVTGPATLIRFPFSLAANAELKDPAHIQGNQVKFTRDLKEDGESVHGPLTGFSEKVGDAEVRVENTKAGIGVRERLDKPISKIYFWSIRTTACPEIYIHIHADPGKTFKWRATYDFYTLK